VLRADCLARPGCDPGEGTLLSALKLVSATLTVGLTPGFSCLILAGLRVRVPLLESGVLGIALSLAVVQGDRGHAAAARSAARGAVVLAGGCAGLGLLAAWRARRAPG
jgi:hypothetical protein